MSRYRSGPPGRAILVVVIIAGLLIGVAAVWGRDIARLTGAERTAQKWAVRFGAASLTPTVAASDGASIGGEALAADGFPANPRRHVLKYVVRSGDSIFGIAQRFGVSPDTIFWANTETLQDNINLLFVGIELVILPVDGVYHECDGEQTIAEIAAEYGVAAGDILYSDYNRLSEEGSSYTPPKGLHIVVPGGRRQYISWRAPIQTGTESGRTNPEGSLHPGSCRAEYTGQGGTSSYTNPLGDALYRVTNGFAPWHPGVDMAGDYGTPITAADTGVIVFAGWHRDGYGELIIIDHGDGWTTYYGHLAQRFVGCGDQVTQGQIIGGMGMTGNATGIHLHWEIRRGDQAQNPYDFLPLKQPTDS